jgi:hypothetical protein
LQRWAWESPQSADEGPREAACVRYPIADGRDTLELQFFVSSSSGAAGPQTRVLLQLVADGAEALLAAPREGSPKIMTPRPERIAQGGG